MLANAALAFYFVWSDGKTAENLITGAVYAVALSLLGLLLYWKRQDSVWGKSSSGPRSP